MALLFCDSFDHYDNATILDKWTSIGGLIGQGGTSIAVGSGRCGTNALQIGSNSFLAKGVTVGGTANVGYAGFAYKLQLQGGITPFCGPINGVGSVPQWQAAVDASGTLLIFNGNSAAPGSQVAASAPDVIRLGTFYFVEFYWLIHSTLGAITAKINGVQVIGATNINTRSVFYGDNNWTGWTLRAIANSNNLFDDLYVLDDVDDGKTPALNTFLGDTSVEYLRPTADGAESQWTVNGGGTHANAVDKNSSASLTTPYISTTTIGNTDTNIYADPILSGACFGVQLSILAQKGDSGVRTIAPVVRQSGADTVGSNYSPPQGNPSYQIATYGRNPTTGNAWSLAEVAADEYGVKVTG